MFGVIDLNDPPVETPELVAERLRGPSTSARAHHVAPDCGMKYLSRAPPSPS